MTKEQTNSNYINVKAINLYKSCKDKNIGVIPLGMILCRQRRSGSPDFNSANATVDLPIFIQEHMKSVHESLVKNGLGKEHYVITIPLPYFISLTYLDRKTNKNSDIDIYYKDMDVAEGVKATLVPVRERKGHIDTFERILLARPKSVVVGNPAGNFSLIKEISSGVLIESVQFRNENTIDSYLREGGHFIELE